MTGKAIVLDANILVRAVLGKRVRELLVANAGPVKFFAPDVAFDETRKYLPGLLEKRGVDPIPTMTVLDALVGIVRMNGQPCLFTGRQIKGQMRVCTTCVQCQNVFNSF
jgi:hypothetical protein